MPLTNRVDPFGAIHAHSARGMLMGNRGCLHDDQRRIVRASDTQAWISCTPRWPGTRRQLMRPGAYTELFFLDEATALAAGHRPCGSCRPDQLKAFKRAWADAHGLSYLPYVPEIDAQLRAAAPEGRRLTLMEEPSPDGTMHRDGEQFLLRWRSAWLPWSFSGYGYPIDAIAADAVVMTSQPMCAVLRAGYAPLLHPTGARALSPPL